jgi:hypothetical protein
MRLRSAFNPHKSDDGDDACEHSQSIWVNLQKRTPPSRATNSLNWTGYNSDDGMTTNQELLRRLTSIQTQLVAFDNGGLAEETRILSSDYRALQGFYRSNKKSLSEAFINHFEQLPPDERFTKSLFIVSRYQTLHKYPMLAALVLTAVAIGYFGIRQKWLDQDQLFLVPIISSVFIMAAFSLLVFRRHTKHVMALQRLTEESFPKLIALLGN